MPDQHYPCTRRLRQSSRHRPGDPSLDLPVNALGADLRVIETLERRSRGLETHRRGEEPGVAIGSRGESPAEFRSVAARLAGADLHFPVRGEEQPAHQASSSAATPGSTRPSRNSNAAPPPVETWVIWSAPPTRADAAARSPPTTTLIP